MPSSTVLLTKRALVSLLLRLAVAYHVVLGTAACGGGIAPCGGGAGICGRRNRRLCRRHRALWRRHWYLWAAAPPPTIIKIAKKNKMNLVNTRDILQTKGCIEISHIL